MGFKTTQDRHLGQSKPSGSTPSSIFSPSTLDLSAAESTRGVTPRETAITHIICCNVADRPVEYSLYFDNDGTTYDDTTAIGKNVDIKKGESHFITTRLIMQQNAGNLAGFSNPSDSVNFTITGELKA